MKWIDVLSRSHVINLEWNRSREHNSCKKDASLWTQFYKVKCEVNIILLYVIYFHLKRFIVFTGDLMRPWEQKLEKMLVVNFKMFCVYTYRRETLYRAGKIASWCWKAIRKASWLTFLDNQIILNLPLLLLFYHFFVDNEESL